jgi:predicted GH43/DUF377 family glycosyl hydrolase
MFLKRFVYVLVSAALVASVLLAARVPLVSGQDQPKIAVSMTLYEKNPVLASEGAQAWESAGQWNPSVILDQDVFHMFYLGCENDVCAVGYATSDDGLTWTRYENNPVFMPDEAVAPAGGVSHTKAYLDGDTWVILFVPALQKNSFAGVVLRATAPDPTGPWTVDPEPVLTASTILEWDNTGYFVHSVVPTDEGYALYYSPANAGGDIGLATSPDGIHWTKYDDPATTDSRHVVSDPVLTSSRNLANWDAMYIAGSIVHRSDSGWEMFYGGLHLFGQPYSIGYATSEDGIIWTPYEGNPVLQQEGTAYDLAPDSLAVVDGTYYLYYNYTVDNIGSIGVATGTVTRE